MSRIGRAFAQSGGRAALIPFLNAGDPTFDLSVRLFETVLGSGADIVEIGMPYSDPLADGPVIQASALRSLQAGFSLPRAFELAAHLRSQTDKGLVLFTYVNPLLQYTPERFFADAAESGADGVIVPDLPFEESAEVRASADQAGIDLIPLVAPTSSEERIAEIASVARGFIYCVSSLGVTGERAKMSDRVQSLVETARANSTLPVAVGFGVSGPEPASLVASYADGVIVGSAFIRRIEQVLHDSDGTEQVAALESTVADFARALKAAIQ